MAIHWQVKFKSLRANELYTVNIYDDNYSGQPVQLIGAADPFSTQEDYDDDMFTPVRRQSGYIRIVDTGRDATDTVNVNWRSIIPTTDTDRPVTLTDSNGNVRWIGFMQAQNFGAALYENPLEREFPVQCPLSVISRAEVDVNPSTMNVNIRNFAYLLWNTLNRIPATARPNQIVVQGGYDALEWLKVKVDWYNFVQEDDDHNPESRYDYGTILEDMCKYWGLTARIFEQTLYLTCADDNGESTALVMDYSELTTLASGTDDGSIETMFSSVSVGDIFASINNKDYQNRGPNTCEINVDPDTYNGHSIDPFDGVLVTEMSRPSWYDGYIESNGDKMWHYTEDVLSCEQMDLNGTCWTGYAAFNILSKYRGADAGGGYDNVGNVIHIKQTYMGAIYVWLKTKFQHCFSDGFLRILADTYREGEKYEEGRFFAGDPAMKARIGIDEGGSAIYWDGRAWQDYTCECLLTIGNKKPELFSRYEISATNYEETSIIPMPSGVTGRLFIELMGTDDSRVDDINGEKCFDLKDFRVEYYKNDNTSYQQYPNSGWCDVNENLDVPRLRYKAHSDSMVKEEYSIESPYGSNQGVPPAYGLLMNADGSYMEDVQYYGARERPEVHLCNRVVNYWATSKRKIECELLAHDGTSATVADGINPRDLVSIDGSTMYPISISRNWRDDVVMLSLMEV